MMNQLRGRLAAEAAAAAASEAAVGAAASAASEDSHNNEEVRLIVVASLFIRTVQGQATDILVNIYFLCNKLSGS